MAQTGDDCYFFYYSACTKGVSCPFRHVEAALGCEVMCTHWQAGNCIRPGCKFRHMEIKVDRSNIPCYWESQPTGCTKAHCAFKHFKTKDLDTVLSTCSTDIAAPRESKTVSLHTGLPDTEVGTLRTTASQQNRASPKIEPVVVNPFEDDSDVESTSGSPQKKALLLKKNVVRVSAPVTSKASVKVTCKPVAASVLMTKPTGLKRKIKLIEKDVTPDDSDGQNDTRHSVSDSDLLKESAVSRRNVIIDGDSDSGKTFHDMLKKSRSSSNVTVKRSPEKKPVKLSVKNRLGRPDREPQQAKPVKMSIKNRLGGQGAGKDDSPPRTNVRSRLGLNTPTANLGAKSLTDLRTEKLQILQQLAEVSAEPEDEEDDTSDIQIKSLEEIKAEKARKAFNTRGPASGERGLQKTVKYVLPPAKPAPKRKIITYSDEMFDDTDKETPEMAEPVAVLKVKTLTDIRAEKAKKQPSVKKERPIYMPPAMKNTVKTLPVKQRISDIPKPVTKEIAISEVKPTSDVKVKTFSEIMAEKRRRQQELRAKFEQEYKPESPKPKVSFTPVVFDIEQEDKPQIENTVCVRPSAKQTLSVMPMKNSNTRSKENVSVNNSSEQRSGGNGRLFEGHVLSYNVCDKVKDREKSVDSEQNETEESTPDVSLPKRRTSSQGSDLPSKKKSKQSVSLAEDDDDFFFGEDLDEFDDGGKLDEGDILQDIDDLLA
ncbi:zinc finger CCCH domain-containing protein 11A-like [Haliotis rufescens]|uniref:zinc finger CCCH domain-containing protein 11A-like n=1 Tax=Haliotis rufescens TaxID=6454 RepID=UPI00201EF62A|nr:zinc finger CCCH domain-containing protein 11A-like [Haliotis rufescens]